MFQKADQTTAALVWNTPFFLERLRHTSERSSNKPQQHGYYCLFPQQTTFTHSGPNTETYIRAKKGFNFAVRAGALALEREQQKADTVLLHFFDRKKVFHVGRNYSNTRFAPAHGENRYSLQIRKYINRDSGFWAIVVQQFTTPKSYLQFFAYHSYPYI
jgi:hypothetical protein